MSITEAPVGQVVLSDEPVAGAESAMGEQASGRVDRDLERLIGTLEPFVRDRDEIRCVLVDASAMPQVPPGLLYTVRLVDRHARVFNTMVDIQPNLER